MHISGQQLAGVSAGVNSRGTGENEGTASAVESVLSAKVVLEMVMTPAVAAGVGVAVAAGVGVALEMVASTVPVLTSQPTSEIREYRRCSG